jgi:spore maturation protein CgeB
MVTDAFDYRQTGWDVEAVMDRLLEGTKPDLIFVSYHHGFTDRFQGLNRIKIPKVGFIGDSYDFLAEDGLRKAKTAFFRATRFDALLSVYPHTDDMVRHGLGTRSIPILHSAWAVDPEIFRPLGLRRRYDIASLGAHTAGKYPFRIAVRQYLDRQREHRFYRRQRVGPHDGPRFARALNRLRACFTCASVYGFTVMKYFEIPACETLLFAETTEALPVLGFRDGENFVAVTPEDFAEKFRHYLREVPPETVARMTRAGRELILARHTWAIRAGELLAEFRRII